MRHESSWRTYANYLAEHTPLSIRDAEILALKRTGHSVEEIKRTLVLYTDTIEDHWEEVLEEWDRAQKFCTIMGPFPPDDDGPPKTDEIYDVPWNLLSSASMDLVDEDTRVELEIYHGESNGIHHTYLAVEREITTVSHYATETTEHRGMYDTNALRKHLYNGTETLDEYYLRWALLEKAGIDPSADLAPAAEDQLDREISETEADAAYERAMDRTELHGGDKLVNRPIFE